MIWIIWNQNIKTNRVWKLNKEKVKIIELISGTSNLDTLLAKFGEIGKNNNIEFVSIIPENSGLCSCATLKKCKK